MSQQYLVLQHRHSDNVEVLLGTLDHSSLERAAEALGYAVVSAGTVAFVKGRFGDVDADVTQGCVALGISVDLDCLPIDKQLIERKFK